MAVIVRRFSWLERTFLLVLGSLAGFFGVTNLIGASGFPLWVVMGEVVVGAVFVGVAVKGVWREQR